MAKYLIEVPHESEVTACARAVKAFLNTGSHFLSQAACGMVPTAVKRDAAQRGMGMRLHDRSTRLQRQFQKRVSGPTSLLRPDHTSLGH